MSYFTETLDVIYEGKSIDYIRGGVPLHKALSKNTRNNFEKVLPTIGSNIKQLNKKLNPGVDIVLDPDVPGNRICIDKYYRKSNVACIKVFAILRDKNGEEKAKKIAKAFNDDDNCTHVANGYVCRLSYGHFEHDDDNTSFPNGSGFIALYMNLD